MGLISFCSTSNDGTLSISMLSPLPPLDTRILRWDYARLHPRRCPFCSSEGEEKFIRPDLLHVRSCSACGAFFVSPGPSAQALNDFYSRYYADHRKVEMQQYLRDTSLLREMLAMDPFTDVKVREIATTMRLANARTLDVGFGIGLTMVLLRKLGARVAGIDLDPEAVDFARSHLGISEIHQLDLLDFTPDQPYDLITFHDLIEHPLDPLSLLKKARSILAPGGLLSIWTPNGSFLLEERDPVQLRVDLEHMQYLSSRTCGVIAQDLGFEIVHLESLGTPRLENVARLSGSHAGGWKRTVRRAIRHVPGFVAMNALRKKLASSDLRRGRYHLFCLLRRRD